MIDGVLFVHGLSGEPDKTWARFPELLRSDPDFEAMTVRSWGYSTRIVASRLLGHVSKIQVLSVGLRTELENRRESQGLIALICHSLGGLVARQYLIDQNFAERPLRVTKLLMFATPNDGSELAKLARRIPFASEQVQQLERGSDLLQTLNRDWRHFNISSQVDAG